MEAASPDVVLIQDEKFDFDCELSDSRDEACVNEGDEDEDEVFFGPIGHKERCVATNTEISEQHINVPSAPMGHNVEVYKEAHFIAKLFKKQSENSTSNTPDAKGFKSDANRGKENLSDALTGDTGKLVNGIEMNPSVARGELQEKNHHTPGSCKEMSFKSPATQSTPKETKLQTPSRKNRVFSPVNVNHLYGLDMTTNSNETAAQSGNETEMPVNSNLLELLSSAAGDDSKEVHKMQDDTKETQDHAKESHDGAKEIQEMKHDTKETCQETKDDTKEIQDHAKEIQETKDDKETQDDAKEIQELKDDTKEKHNDSEQKHVVAEKTACKTSRSGLRPPGFGISSIRRTSSSSSISSTSSSSSLCTQNLDDTFGTQSNSSWTSQNSSFSSKTASARQPVKIKSSLKSLGNGTAKMRVARPNDTSKIKNGKPIPLKAAPRGKAPRIASLRTPARVSSTTNGPNLSIARQRGSTSRNNSEVFTPVIRRGSSQAVRVTPSKHEGGGDKAKVGLPVKRQERQKSAQESVQRTLVRQREGGATQARVTSWSKASTPARRGTASETSQSDSRPKRRTSLMKGATPTGSRQTTPVQATATEPRAGQKDQQRASLGASRKKRRSLLPTPVSSRCSCVDTEHQNATPPIPFNISPVTPDKAQTTSAPVSRGPSSSEASNPFSPPTVNDGLSADVDTNASDNVISLSPAVSHTQEDLINFGPSPVNIVPNLVDIE